MKINNRLVLIPLWICISLPAWAPDNVWCKRHQCATEYFGDGYYCLKCQDQVSSYFENVDDSDGLTQCIQESDDSPSGSTLLVNSLANTDTLAAMSQLLAVRESISRLGTKPVLAGGDWLQGIDRPARASQTSPYKNELLERVLETIRNESGALPGTYSGLLPERLIPAIDENRADPELLEVMLASINVYLTTSTHDNISAYLTNSHIIAIDVESQANSPFIVTIVPALTEISEGQQVFTVSIAHHHFSMNLADVLTFVDWLTQQKDAQCKAYIQSTPL